ncbi:TRAP transporter large permease subunit [uncultured Hoeflea sp.]|uniref:TRAP transporter large permease subunit n=1 Tax=uncultured Hoeflea sp. TaxID=538666 RepID=UPI0030EBA8AA
MLISEGMKYDRGAMCFLCSSGLRSGLAEKVPGWLINSLAMILPTIPAFFPIVVASGFDPVWFGVVVVLVAGTGTITPPIGIDV